MNDNRIQLLEEKSRWRARDVTYWSGQWAALSMQLPTFRTEDFRALNDGPANPYFKTVVRQPRTPFEQLIPVAVVSKSYTLAQHLDVAEKCFEGLRAAFVGTENLKCEVGLTELGEWMNLRIYFPDFYSHKPGDGKIIRLRLECVNSVDGSSRLMIMLSWIRIVCTNGIIIPETRTEIRDIHNEYLNLDRIPQVVKQNMDLVKDDLRKLGKWDRTAIDPNNLRGWANGVLSNLSGGARRQRAVFFIFAVLATMWK